MFEFHYTRLNTVLSFLLPESPLFELLAVLCLLPKKCGSQNTMKSTTEKLHLGVTNANTDASRVARFSVVFAAAIL